MQEWYLIGNTTKPNMIGGYENDGFLDCKDDAFSETLETDLANTVTLYNYDLSESSQIRCIIQGNTAETQLKSMERTGLFVRGTVKAGMYIFFEDRYWLITGYPGNNGIYEKATLQLCQYKLRWQNSNGEIIERWICATSAAKYDVGEKSNNTIILTTDNLTLLFPDDEESLNIYGKRVFIDKRIPPQKVYKITRSDDVLYDYGEHGAVLAFIADKTELNTTTDRPDLGVCDYIDTSITTPTPPSPSDPDKTADLSAEIDGSNDLKVTVPFTYTATLKDSKENEVTWDDTLYRWNVVGDSNIVQGENGNKITLKAGSNKLIGEKIVLQVINIVDDMIIGEIKISISSLMNKR